MNVVFYANELIASGHIRGIVPAAEMNRRGRVRVMVKQDILYSDRPGTQAVVVQRQSNPNFPAMLKEMRAQGIITLYDVDDDLFSLPITDEKRKADYLAGVRACMEAVDCVVCSTRHLEEAVREEVPAVRATVTVENGVDLQDGNWEPHRLARVRQKTRPQVDRVEIGWYGHMLHASDAPLVGPVLAAILAKHPNAYLHLVGQVGPDQLSVDLSHLGDRVIYDNRWHDITELPEIIRHFDIGLAVQADTRYNRCRSNLKWQEMAALDIPVVASAMPAYASTLTHGADGFLCSNQQEWYDALDALVSDRAMREEVGRSGRLTLESKFCVQVQAPRWEQMYRELMNSVDFG